MSEITQPWIDDADTQTVMKCLESGGHRVYFVGGCVRNALLGLDVADIDMATDATPERVSELMEAAGIKVIATGAAHGTVTVVANNHSYEITTFRADTETDGRHATVAFTTDIETDARRRDFTMNALYADRGGKVIDPLGGMDDLQDRRIRFIEDAAQRIQEDYLRILRYFRFFAHYADQEAGLDPDALAAIADNLDGIDQLSRERIGTEMLKLLTAPDPSMAVAAMAQTGVLLRVLPGASAEVLPKLTHFEEIAGIAPAALRRLASLGGEVDLRLSRKQMRDLALLGEAAAGTDPAGALGYRHGAALAMDICLLRAAMFETAPEPDFSDQASRGAAEKFPVRASDLSPKLKGPAIGETLRRMEEEWIRSGFARSKEELLRH